MPLRAGDMLGDYRVLDLIGTGGMGHVYKVQNILSNRVEAMKVVLPDKADELTERFLREIQVQASLIHPHITGLHTALRVEGQLVMIMELVVGESLKDRLERGPLSVGECVEYGRQVLDALAYAHRQNVVHRDIKPANIMLSDGGQAKLMDFGLASAGFDKRLTRTGTVMGSLYYMAPEQVKGLQLTSRSDLYSFGLTLYEMLTGVRGIQGDSDYAIMTAHLQTEPRAPMLCNPAVPQPLSDLVLRSVSKDPEERFPSAEVFRDALEQFARSAPAPLFESTAAESNAREPAAEVLAVPTRTAPETGLPETPIAAPTATPAPSSTPQATLPATLPATTATRILGPLRTASTPDAPTITFNAPAVAAPSPAPPVDAGAEKRFGIEATPGARRSAPPGRRSSRMLIIVGVTAAVVLASAGVYRYAAARFAAAPASGLGESPAGEKAVTGAVTADIGSNQQNDVQATAPAPPPRGIPPQPDKKEFAKPALGRSPDVAGSSKPAAAASSVREFAPSATKESPAILAPAAPTPAAAPAAPVVEAPKPPQKTAEQLQAEEAARAWEIIASSTDPAVLRSFHTRYPQSVHAAQALSLAERIESQSAAQAAARAEEGRRKAADANVALRQEVVAVLHRLEAAYAGRGMPQIRAVWPGIDGDHVKRLEEAFRDTRSMSLTLEPTADPRPTQSGAQVECRYLMVSLLKNTKSPRRMEGTATVLLTRANGSLVVEDIDYKLASRSLFKPL